MMKTKAMVYVFPALTTLPAFLGSTFKYYIIGISLAFFITAILTFLLGIDEEKDEPKEEKMENKLKVKTEINEGIFINSCIDGEAIELSKVKDEAFSSGVMGKGIGIIPNSGYLYAPADGEISTVFITKHAVGMVTDEGVEILMHIGINTVELEGKGFKQIVKDGQRVKKGDILIEFDIDLIKDKNYDTTTIMIISNTEEYSDIEVLNLGNVNKDTEVLEIRG